MALKDEDLMLLKYADAKTFTDLHTKSIEEEHKNAQEQFMVRLFFFLLLLLSNGYIFFFKGYMQYFSSLTPNDLPTSGNPGSFLSSFILGAIFIWLPSDMLTSLGKMNFNSSASSGSNMSVTPALAFRFFGWVIFSLPTVIFVISTI